MSKITRSGLYQVGAHVSGADLLRRAGDFETTPATVPVAPCASTGPSAYRRVCVVAVAALKASSSAVSRMPRKSISTENTSSSKIGRREKVVASLDLTVVRVRNR